MTTSRVPLPPSALERRGAGRVGGRTNRPIELVLSVVLRGGVLLSAIVIVSGLVLMFSHHPRYDSFSGATSYHRLTSPATPFPHSFAALVAALGRGEGRGVVVLGLLLLILTPVVRVAVSLVACALERDWRMTLVIAVVLAALVGSFFIGRALS